MAKLAFQGNIKKGKFSLNYDEKQLFLNCCSKLKDGQYKLTLEKQHECVTWEQYKTLYGVLYKEIAKNSGHTIDEVDMWMKNQFWHDRIVIQNKESKICEFKQLKSKTTMTIVDMIHFIDYIYNWFCDFYGYTIPIMEELIAKWEFEKFGIYEKQISKQIESEVMTVYE